MFFCFSFNSILTFFRCTNSIFSKIFLDFCFFLKLLHYDFSQIFCSFSLFILSINYYTMLLHYVLSRIFCFFSRYNFVTFVLLKFTIRSESPNNVKSSSRQSHLGQIRYINLTLTESTKR